MDMINLMRYAAAMLLVLALAGAAMLVKRYGGNASPLKNGLKLKMGNWDFSQSPRRLAIVETLMLGPRQRLFIIRRDNVEHLVLSGPEGASVIEGNIGSQGGNS
jgi:flagellar protein FliO/FliZ